jgi:hypothetical protein
MPTPAANDWVLTTSERTRFDEAVRRAGLDPEAAWKSSISVNASGALAGNHVKTIEVESVEAWNALVGTPTSPFEHPAAVGAHPVPEAIELALAAAPSRAALMASTSADHVRHLQASAEAHVFGDASRATTNLALVNQLLYPITVDVLAAQSLTLEPGARLSLSGNHVLLILGTLNIGAGAQIQSTANTVLNVQVAYSAND